MEFSKSSRRRLLKLLNSINRKKAPLPTFVTLTYPASWPEDPQVWKKHLEAFRSRLVRRYGKFPVVWRLEFQSRGAPHFHLLLFMECDRSQLIPWITRSWYQIVQSGDPKHLRAGTRVEAVRSWNGVNAYAAKYMGKLEKLELGVQLPGRFWGVWYRNLLPIELIKVTVDRDTAVRIRRHLARHAGISLKSSKDLRDLEVFVPDWVLERLLEYYGYYRT